VADEVNLDTGTAIAFVAEGSVIRHQLKAYVSGKGLVMTATALRELQILAAKYAGPLEQARLSRFLARVRTASDAPSARAVALQVTGNLGANDIIILGTGDKLGIVTMTADVRAVRAAKAQAVEFAVYLHLPIFFAGT